MLFDFRTPRTRPWASYLKKLYKFLEKNDKTEHISSFFRKAVEKRQQLVPILDDCAKNNYHRPDDIIKILEEYLPLLENICESVKKNVLDLNGKLDVVWTSTLTFGINAKSLSNSIEWERVNCYNLLGLSHYHKAISLHRKNRQETNEKMKNKPKKEYDPIFDDPIEEKNEILDDKEIVKQITSNLKKAASVWKYSATNLYPIEVAKKNYDIIPEVYRDIPSILSAMSAANAQEFMVQLAVQTNKSALVTSKLSMGVGEKFASLYVQLQNGLSKEILGTVAPEFRYYLDFRSYLYKAISLKYYGMHVKQQEKHGECIIYFKTGIDYLKKLPFPKKQKEFTATLKVIQASVNRQIQSIQKEYSSAKSDNDMIYHDIIPESIDTVTKPEAKWFIKFEEFKGFTDNVDL